MRYRVETAPRSARQDGAYGNGDMMDGDMGEGGGASEDDEDAGAGTEERRVNMLVVERVYLETMTEQE